MVVGSYQMIIDAGNNTATYGVINSNNAGYLGNALTTGSAVKASYCTDCAAGISSPNIIRLIITAPSVGSNVWTAEDSLGSGPNTDQGKYTFVITPTINVSSYGAGANLNVGNYVLSANNLNTVSGYKTNYRDVSNKPTIYNSGSLSITPKELTYRKEFSEETKEETKTKKRELI
jgi:hypothetical protein